MNISNNQKVTIEALLAQLEHIVGSEYLYHDFNWVFRKYEIDMYSYDFNNSNFAFTESLRELETTVKRDFILKFYSNLKTDIMPVAKFYEIKSLFHTIYPILDASSYYLLTLMLNCYNFFPDFGAPRMKGRHVGNGVFEIDISFSKFSAGTKWPAEALIQTTLSNDLEVYISEYFLKKKYKEYEATNYECFAKDLARNLLLKDDTPYYFKVGKIEYETFPWMLSSVLMFRLSNLSGSAGL